MPFIIKTSESFPVTRPFVVSAAFACLAVAFWPALAASADDTASGNGGQELQTVIVEATAIPGAVIDADKIPGNIQTLSASDLSREGTASLTRAMDSKLGSIN